MIKFEKDERKKWIPRMLADPKNNISGLLMYLVNDGASGKSILTDATMRRMWRAVLPYLPHWQAWEISKLIFGRSLYENE